MEIKGLHDSSATTPISGTTPSSVNSMATPLNSSKSGLGAFSENADRAQLSKLSSVLNGLEQGASVIRRHVQHAMSAVRGGTYQIDPLQLSKRIVGEALRSV